MKLILKLAVGAALASYGAGAFAALATDTSTNGGDVYLIIDDQTTFKEYVVDINVATNTVLSGSVLSTAAYASSPSTGTVAGYSFGNLSAGTTLTQFISGIGASDTVIWGVAGASNTSTPMIVTSSNGPINKTNTPKNSFLASMEGTGAGAYTAINTNITNWNGAGEGTFTYGSGNSSDFQNTWGGYLTSSGTFTTASGGGTLNLYGLATNGTSASTHSQLINFGTVSLDSSGNLTFASAVPLPAAAWLFGSGLLGLFGVGRRRRA